MTSHDACYLPVCTEKLADGSTAEIFMPTSHTASPWGAHLQHGGPFSALMTRAMDRLDSPENTRISRIVVEILGPVTMTDIRISARVERPGRRISLLSSTLETRQSDGSWRVSATAYAWRILTSDSREAAYTAAAMDVPSASIPQEHMSDRSALPPEWSSGFVDALSWRIAEAPRIDGPAFTWLKMKVPLVAGETITPLEHLVAIADVANGTGASVDYREWTFLNTDLTIHLFTPPQPGWIGMNADTSIGPDGIGMSSATLHQETGPLGRVNQILLIERRPQSTES